jgi:hypothetical protein
MMFQPFSCSNGYILKVLMDPRAKIPVIASTALLVVYVLLIAFDAPMPLVTSIFTLSPFAIVWTVYAVIRHDRYKGRELQEGEEWGYGK